MGILLSSPPPSLSPDIIPAFSAKSFFNETVNPRPLLPAIATDAQVWYPLPEASADGEAVRAKWSGTPGLGAGAADKAVECWLSLSFCTGWDQKDMSGKAPGRLLVKEVWESVFLEPPREGPARLV